MEIKIINNAPTTKVTLKKESENAYIVKVDEKKNKFKWNFSNDNIETKRLGEIPCGSVVTIGERKYIVLDHAAETTALLDANKIDERAFDNNDDGDYETSYIRKCLNDKYYKELCAAVGENNIIKHKVNLEADDGSNKNVFCEDYVSLITTTNYRRYREYIPAAGYAWWTATRVTTADKNFSRFVCYVCISGVLNWVNCRREYCVRPYIVLDSSVRVTCDN